MLYKNTLLNIKDQNQLQFGFQQQTDSEDIKFQRFQKASAYIASTVLHSPFRCSYILDNETIA